MKKRFLLLIPLLLSSCNKSLNSQSAEMESENLNDRAEERVIYGSDGRMDVYQAPLALQTLARSSVALVKSTDLASYTTAKFKLKTKSYKTTYHLCSDEPFANQETAAFCSGSLIGKNLILTAGHCITNQTDCTSTKFIFDFKQNSATTLNKIIPKKLVFSCKKILATRLEANGLDFAVVELDRDVTDRKPVVLEKSISVRSNDSVFVIGHPTGLPTKITLGGVVRSITGDYFTTNLDTYGGNSGSPVFDSKTQRQVGVLVRGDQDYEFQNGCYRSKKCTETGCRGEDVTQMSSVLLNTPM